MLGTTVVIDADAHINEPIVRSNPPEDEMALWRGLAQRRPGWQEVGRSGDHMVNLVGGKLYPRQEGRGRGVPIDSAMNPAAASGAELLDDRLRDLDSEGIDVQVLYGALSLGVTTFVDKGLAEDFCRTYNDWLIQVCSTAPKRLKAASIVPLQDVAMSVKELERAYGLGAVAVTVPPVVGELNLDAPELEPFFEAAAHLEIAVAIHSAPGMNVPLPGAERFDNYAQVHCLSFPVDQMVALTALAMGGVLDHYPSLRVVFLESGIGWVPYYLARMEEHREKRSDMLKGMKSHPREYLVRGQCFFSFECEDPFLEAYIDHLGYESLVFSSDYPHWDCEFPGTMSHFAKIAEPLSKDAITAVAGGNAMRLYGMDAQGTPQGSRGR